MIPIGTKITIQYHPEPWGTWIHGWKGEEVEKHPPVTVEYEINDKFIRENPVVWEMLHREPLKEGLIIFGPGKNTTIKIIKMTNISNKDYSMSNKEIRLFRKKAQRADKALKRIRDTIAGSSPQRLNLGTTLTTLNSTIQKELKWPKKKQIGKITKKQKEGITSQIIEYSFKNGEVKIRSTNRKKAFKEARKLLGFTPTHANCYDYNPNEGNKLICVRPKEVKSFYCENITLKNLNKYIDADWEIVPRYWYKRYLSALRNGKKATPHVNRIQPNSIFLRRLKVRPGISKKAQKRGQAKPQIKYIQYIPIKKKIENNICYSSVIHLNSKFENKHYYTKPNTITKIVYKSIIHR